MSESNYIFDATLENFQQGVLDNSEQLPVVVDFWADWCQPCKILMPILDKLVQEFDGAFLLAKVDSDAQQELSARYQVRSIPSVKIFRHGKVVEEFTGVQSEDSIRSLIKAHITTAAGKLRNEAIALIRQGDMPAGRDLLQQAADMEPDNALIQIDLAHADAGAGNYTAAQERLKKLPLAEQEKPEVSALWAKVEFALASEQAEDRQTLLQKIETDPKDSAARYQLAAQCVVAGDYACALDQLLHIVMTDRQYNDDAGRRAMLSIFNLLGDDHELTSQYRRKMFNAMH